MKQNTESDRGTGKIRWKGNSIMEIERKYLVKKVPENLDQYVCLEIEQAYLNREPVVRIRRQNQEYILTYKGSGMMIREEYNLPLDKKSYEHLRRKADGKIITKKRYLIPIEHGLCVELDVFEGVHQGVILAEVEFPDQETCDAFQPLDWFAEDVTMREEYHNSYMSKEDRDEERIKTQ